MCRPLFVAAAVLPAMGCLVTDKIDFPEEANVPPSVASSASAENPLDRIVVFDPDSASGGDGGAEELRFQVIVRDPNVQQALEAKIFVNNVSTPVLEREVPSMGSEMARPFEFTLPGRLLTTTAGSCQKVELLVSGGFRFGSRAPVLPNDVAQAVWWVRSGRRTEAVDMELCPR